MTLQKDRRLSDITPVKSSVTEDIKKMQQERKQLKLNKTVAKVRQIVAVAAMGLGDIALIAQNGHRVVTNTIAVYTASVCVVGLVLYFGFNKK